MRNSKYYMVHDHDQIMIDLQQFIVQYGWLVI